MAPGVPHRNPVTGGMTVVGSSIRTSVIKAKSVSGIIAACIVEDGITVTQIVTNVLKLVNKGEKIPLSTHQKEVIESERYCSDLLFVVFSFR